MKISTLFRKISLLFEDAVLRQFVMGLFVRKWSAHSIRRQQLPPYLSNVFFQTKEPTIDQFKEFQRTQNLQSLQPLKLVLPGETIELNLNNIDDLLVRPFEDLETTLALHRFSWITALTDAKSAAWVNLIWRKWCEKFGNIDDQWAWHPYTTAERSINIINFSKRFGLPGEKDKTQAVLKKSGDEIFHRLEYFGEHNTGNHLMNNGRGLFLLGLELGIEQWADIGGKILIEEANRNISPSGILREGSSHYHLLVTHWYIECWLTALKNKRSETNRLKIIVSQLMQVAHDLHLPGGFPLIGDISPDSPPSFLINVMDDSLSERLNLLSNEDRLRVRSLITESADKSSTSLADGYWQRADFFDWSGLWHNSVNGWQTIPGHSHRDTGSFEIHWQDQPLFRDLGRRSYTPAGNQDIQAATHNSLLIDNLEPDVIDKPYYPDKFRNKIIGQTNTLKKLQNSVVLDHGAFSRLPKIDGWRRSWDFSEDQLVINDQIEGIGHHHCDRYLHTTLPVEKTPGGVKIGSFQIFCEGELEISPSSYWFSYGHGRPATSLKFSNNIELPWQSEIIVRKI
jgi:hypothetical protein